MAEGQSMTALEASLADDKPKALLMAISTYWTHVAPPRRRARRARPIGRVGPTAAGSTSQQPGRPLTNFDAVDEIEDALSFGEAQQPVGLGNGDVRLAARHRNAEHKPGGRAQQAARADQHADNLRKLDPEHVEGWPARSGCRRCSCR